MNWLKGIFHNDSPQELAYILAAFCVLAAVVCACVAIHWPAQAEHAKGLVDRFLLASGGYLGYGKFKPDAQVPQ